MIGRIVLSHSPIYLTVFVQVADRMLSLAADHTLRLDEVLVVEEDRVVTLVLPAVDGVEDRCELVQPIIHCADLVRVRVSVGLGLG